MQLHCLHFGLNLQDYVKDNFSKLTCPVFVALGDDDDVINNDAAIHLYSQLRNLKNRQVTYEGYTH